jgi:hypothetical protein
VLTRHSKIHVFTLHTHAHAAGKSSYGSKSSWFAAAAAEGRIGGARMYEARPYETGVWTTRFACVCSGRSLTDKFVTSLIAYPHPCTFRSARHDVCPRTASTAIHQMNTSTNADQISKCFPPLRAHTYMHRTPVSVVTEKRIASAVVDSGFVPPKLNNVVLPGPPSFDHHHIHPAHHDQANRQTYPTDEQETSHVPSRLGGWPRVHDYNVTRVSCRGWSSDLGHRRPSQCCLEADQVASICLTRSTSFSQMAFCRRSAGRHCPVCCPAG